MMNWMIFSPELYFLLLGGVFLFLSLTRGAVSSRCARITSRAGVDGEVKKRHIRNCRKTDPAYGKSVADALGIALEDVGAAARP